MPFCPKCKAEFREGFTECNECHIPLVDELPADDDAAQAALRDFASSDAQAAPTEIEQLLHQPIAVYTAVNRLEAATVCDVLREHGITALDRPAAFRRAQAYTGVDARFGVEIVVDAAQTAKARSIIDELKNELETPVDEEELTRLAEEQAEQAPEQPAEDNAAFRLLPAVIGVIAVALVLLYLVAR